MSIFIFVLLQLVLSVHCELVNTKILRKINVETQLVKIDLIIFIQNLQLNYANKIIYMLDPDGTNYYIKFKNEKNEELFYEISNNEFHVKLDKRLQPNESTQILVELIYTNKTMLSQKYRTPKQDQLVLYNGNLYFYSPYKTLSLKTIYTLQHSNYLQTTHPPNYHNETKVMYLHKNINPFSYECIKLEFKNNNPSFIVTNLERIIAVSHFGQITVEDHVYIKNEGNKLMGHFELTTLNWLYTHLPASANSVKYFDILGNSSKSNLLDFNDHITLKFKPRYPLLSGWKTSYIIQYKVPVYEYLYHDNFKQFVLKMRAVDHILNDCIIEKVTVKILLPEASHSIQVDMPQKFDKAANELHFTSLSMFGRPTIVLNGSNILENNISDFMIQYLFNMKFLFQLPLLLILYVESVFLFVILLIRFNEIKLL